MYQLYKVIAIFVYSKKYLRHRVSLVLENDTQTENDPKRR